MDEMIKQIKVMIEKAAKAEKSDDALKFSQAACNAANASHVIYSIKGYSQIHLARSVAQIVERPAEDGKRKVRALFDRLNRIIYMDEEEIQMRSVVLQMALSEDKPKKKERVISDDDRERNKKMVDAWFQSLIGKQPLGGLEPHYSDEIVELSSILRMATCELCSLFDAVGG